MQHRNNRFVRFASNKPNDFVAESALVCVCHLWNAALVTLLQYSKMPFTEFQLKLNSRQLADFWLIHFWILCYLAWSICFSCKTVLSLTCLVCSLPRGKHHSCVSKEKCARNSQLKSKKWSKVPWQHVASTNLFNSVKSQICSYSDVTAQSWILFDLFFV